MKYSRFFLAAAMAALLTGDSMNVSAQDETDALRYSFLTPMGTARSMGFGSALGSVGGDFSSLSINPAGIGIYRSSEVMFTPALKFNSNSSNYLGTTRDDNSVKVNFNNLGIVFTRQNRGKDYETSSWKTVSFGIGLNRLADFTRHYNYGGLMKGTGNQFSSFSELFVADANANPGNIQDDRTMGYLGYQSFLVDEDSLGFFPVPNWETGIFQKKSVQERGGINELVLSLGGNYQEKIMVGATLGLPSVRYVREMFFEETDATNNPDNFFNSFRYTENLKTTGMGVNLKLGAIVKPSDAFRLGVAIHTPTWYALTDVSNAGIVSNTEGFKAYLGQSDTNPVTNVQGTENSYSYRLMTPWRAIVSATAFMGKNGFITADYEYVDYKSMRYTFDNEFADEASLRNDYIKHTFQGVSNFRVGIEGRLDEFFGRAGLGYYGNPYKESSFKHNRTDLSIGIGYRAGNFFTDLAFVHSMLNNDENPYLLPSPVVTPVASLKDKLNTIAFTFGWKF